MRYLYCNRATSLGNWTLSKRTSVAFSFASRGHPASACYGHWMLIHYSVLSLYKVPEASPVPHCMICWCRSNLRRNRFHDYDRMCDELKRVRRSSVFTSFFVTSFSSVSKAALRRIVNLSFDTDSKDRSHHSSHIISGRPFKGSIVWTSTLTDKL